MEWFQAEKNLITFSEKFHAMLDFIWWATARLSNVGKEVGAKRSFQCAQVNYLRFYFYHNIIFQPLEHVLLFLNFTTDEMFQSKDLEDLLTGSSATEDSRCSVKRGLIVREKNGAILRCQCVQVG